MNKATGNYMIENYSEITKGAGDVIMNSAELVYKAAREVPLPKTEQEPFTIVDLGATDGGTAQELWYQVIKILREERKYQGAIHLIFEDQPSNDFRPLFERYEGSDQFREQFENVFVLASGVSFYHQIVKSESVHIAYSATAQHWLSEMPKNTHLKNVVHHAQVTSNSAKKENQTKDNFAATDKMKAQAASDWKVIVEQRVKELVKGGRFIAVNFTTDDQGQYLGYTTKRSQSMYDNFNSIAQEFVKEGKITEQEYDNYTFPNYYRSKEEIQEPIKNGSIPQLKVISIDTRVVNCPYREKFENGQYKSNEEFAENLIPTTRSWSDRVFFNALSSSRSVEERNNLVNEFYNCYKKRVAASPDGHAMDYVHTYFCSEKQ